ncbi:multidrug resistance protein 4 [Fomitopsis serialis]|uniref:multidrug resistance protein 4 n=1 Tax=Fomitopsis serialis TaxID=139415 RepID=UPI002007E9F1|nr:multidrug resistance protein 4 [Neoantrodia serialis]KAH9938543.1 multidrug resistance protein 4 [Neoantrodia serialis]
MSDSQDAASPASRASSTKTAAGADSGPRRSGAADTLKEPLKGGEGDSAIPADTKQEALENAEEDWAHDPANPRNWKFGKKWTMTAIVSLYTFITPLASSMMAPGLPQIAEHYKITNETVTALTLSIFLLTFAIGPLFFGPISEMYGRTWVYHIANLLFLAFNLGCAFSDTIGILLGFRLLAGFAGSAPIACGGGTVSDLFSEKDRASAMAVFSLGPLIGPVVGPIAGGFIAQTIGFKYVFIVIAALCGVGAVLGIPFLRETYHPTIRLRRAKRASDPEKVAEAHPHLIKEHSGKLHRIRVDLSRPFILLTTSYVCFLLSLYMALIYGIYYLMFTTFPDLFTIDYGFGIGVSGLAYIGLGLGFVLATVVGASVADSIYHKLAQRNGGKGTPEMRIPALIFGSLFVPIGLFWYGWSAQAHTHWIMPIIGSGIFGFGMMTTFLPIQLYLVDSFAYAASALAAASVFRSMLGFAFPLFGQQMFDALGYGGGNSLLAGLGIVIGIPFPIWLYFSGERIRAKSSLSR